METEFVTGMPDYMGGSGDPSPLTAYGVYMGMKAAAKKHWGKDSLSGKKILVQGAGNVGQYLMGYLVEEGAKVLVCDISEAKLKHAKEKYPAIEVIPNVDIFSHEIDIYAPCALGATVNTESINKMKCPVIAGAANNQLADENVHGPMLVEKGIHYVPDFLINAGGIINISIELDGYNRDRALNTVAKIYNRTLDIFHLAETDKVHTQLAAMRIAEKRLADIAHLRVGI